MSKAPDTLVALGIFSNSDPLQPILLLLGILVIVVLLMLFWHGINVRRQRIQRLHEEVEKLRQALSEFQRAKDLFVHALGHEVRHSQTTLIGFMEFARSQAEAMGATGVVKDLARAYEGHLEMNRLISNLVDLTRLEEKKLTLREEELDLSTLVDDKLPLFARLLENRQVKLKWAQPLWLPLVRGDRDLLGRVIENLLANAVQRTPVNGMIQIAVATAFSGPGVEMMVKDSGEWIPPEEQALLFEKFEQVGGKRLGRRSSIGLGLAFCRVVVQTHRGKMWVQSQQGKGTTFIFQLPMVTG